VYDSEAYTDENLASILDSHDSVPDYLERRDVRGRILDVARQWADRDGQLDDDNTRCLIATTWTNWASDELDYDSGSLNQVALGVMDTKTSSATLFTDTVVVQDSWLQTGDGRKTKLRQYDDAEFEASDRGELWLPDGAADYIAVIALSNELLYDDPSMAEAM